MGRSTVLRAVQQADGSYRIALDPPDVGIDTARACTAAEVERLAADLDAELRWVSPPDATRSADLWGGTLPAEATRSADPWDGTLPAGDQDSGDQD